MPYSSKVIDHYENPRNVGRFDEKNLNVGTGMVGAPACGDVMRLQIEVKDNIIEDAKFKTYGCGSAIASSSLLTEWVKGQTLDAATSIKNTQIVNDDPNGAFYTCPDGSSIPSYIPIDYNPRKLEKVEESKPSAIDTPDPPKADTPEIPKNPSIIKHHPQPPISENTDNIKLQTLPKNDNK
mgnify:CR=1 FL=1